MGQITIADVRAKFPQYDSLSDGDLANAIHNKYYPDMERSAFNRSIGFDDAPTAENRPQARPVVTPEEAAQKFSDQVQGLDFKAPPRGQRQTPEQPPMLSVDLGPGTIGSGSPVSIGRPTPDAGPIAPVLGGGAPDQIAAIAQLMMPPASDSVPNTNSPVAGGPRPTGGATGLAEMMADNPDARVPFKPSGGPIPTGDDPVTERKPKQDSTSEILTNPKTKAAPAPTAAPQSIEQLAAPLFSMMGGVGGGMQDQAQQDAIRLGIQEREAAAAPQVPAEADPFEGEGAAALLKRRGQQFARGATEVGASLPETAAIAGFGNKNAAASVAAEEIQRAQSQIADAEKYLADRPQLGEEGRARVMDVIASSKQIIEANQPLVDVAEGPVKPAAGERDLFKKGEQVREASGEFFGTPDPRDKSFWGAVAEGGGNMTGMVISSLAASALGGPVAGLAVGGGTGSAMNTSQMYREAIEAGSDEETAKQAAQWGAAIGASEIIPINRALKLLPPRLRGEMTKGFLRKFVDIAQSSGEEAAQEYLATVANNIVAQKLYDEDRGWTEGATEAALVGAVLGGGTGAVGAIVEGRGQEEPPEEAPAPAQPRAPQPGATPRQPAPEQPVAPAAQPQAPVPPAPTQQPEPVQQPDPAPAPAADQPTEQIAPDQWEAVQGMKDGQPTGRTWMTNNQTGETISEQDFQARLAAQSKPSPQGGGEVARNEGVNDDPTPQVTSGAGPTGVDASGSPDRSGNQPDAGNLQGSDAIDNGTAGQNLAPGAGASEPSPIRNGSPTEMDAGPARPSPDAGVSQQEEGAAQDTAAPDRPAQWDAMTPEDREKTLRSMGGFDKRDGNLTKGGQNAIKKGWGELSDAARSKIEDAWSGMEDTERFLAQTPEQQKAEADRAQTEAERKFNEDRGTATPDSIEGDEVAAKERGQEHFKSGGKRVLPDYIDPTDTVAAEAWYRGWDEANVAAPVENDARVQNEANDRERDAQISGLTGDNARARDRILKEFGEEGRSELRFAVRDGKADEFLPRMAKLLDAAENGYPKPNARGMYQSSDVKSRDRYKSNAGQPKGWKGVPTFEIEVLNIAPDTWINSVNSSVGNSGGGYALSSSRTFSSRDEALQHAVDQVRGQMERAGDAKGAKEALAQLEKFSPKKTGAEADPAFKAAKDSGKLEVVSVTAESEAKKGKSEVGSTKVEPKNRPLDEVGRQWDSMSADDRADLLIKTAPTADPDRIKALAGKAWSDIADRVKASIARRMPESELDVPKGFSVRDTRKSTKEERVNDTPGREYTSIGTREAPYAVERGFGDTRQEAERDALRKVGAFDAKPVDIDAAAAEADTNPTDAQKEAGNYKMGHANWQGLDISIENAKGSIRSKTNSQTGKSWSVKMPAHYGYIKRTEGADGDHVDVYLGDNMESTEVFVIDQVHPDGDFDEHKVMLGYDDAAAAMADHADAFSDGSGPSRNGGVTRMDVAEFKEWLENGDTSKPLTKKKGASEKTPQSSNREDTGSTQNDTALEDNASQPTVRLGQRLADLIGEDGFPSTSMKLMKMAAEEFGGTIAEGAFSPKDAYEALELAMNTFAADNAAIYDPKRSTEEAKKAVTGLQNVLDTFPTQTRRDTETDAFQQFSTPPTYGYAVNWIANLQEGERVLEPSAGNGGIAVFAKNAGAIVDVNELAERRVPSLKALGFDRVTTEDAEQIANIWNGDDTRSYDVVVMNPPFSASAGRTSKSANTSATGAKHIDQALSVLKDGGRLVAIMGHTFQPGNSRVAPFFKRLEANGYTLRANVVVKGDQVYKKYGTTYDNRLLVIDKVAPAEGSETLKGEVENIPDLIDMMEGIRNEASNRRTKDEAGQPDGGVEGRDGGQQTSTDGGTDGTGKPERTSEPDDMGGTADRQGRSGRANPADGNADGSTRSSKGADGGRKSVGNDAGKRADGSSRTASDDSRKPTVRTTDAEQSNVEETSGGFAKYRPSRVRITGAKEHPIALVESSAMATVTPPKPNYELQLPAKMVKDGLISEAQLEQVLYAGAAHSQMLPALPDQAPRRKGYYIGDGTGVGKTREIAGIVADNWAQGRKKHILISKDKKLLKGARRDFDNVGMKSVPINDLGKVKATDSVDTGTDGVLFATYSTIGKTATAGKKSRLDQIIEWVGPDFDGTITFDEAHLAGNALPIKGKRGTSKPSATALAVVDLQKQLPNARVVYASATAATEVYNLAYADRLGLWGPGTPFPTVESFVTQIDKGGVAAMEVVARDMKQMGVYMARSISFDGVEYGKVEHQLTADQRAMYDAAAEGWQNVLANVQTVVEEHTEGGGRQRGAALAQFWGAHQRFFQQVLTAMQMPTILSNIEADLKAGLSPVIQIVNTNEAATKRAMAKLEEGDTLDDIDITPREDLIQYLETSFPIHQYEDYEDDNGNIRQRPVQDAKGNFVVNKEAVRIRDELIGKLGSMTLPGNPLDMIIDKFGADNVAEVTGRTTRIIQKNGKRVQERRSQNKTLAEASEFQGGKRDVLIFSDAGGTGMDFHADKGAKNTKRRSHYVLQAGWRADRAIQGFGRTHRTNQVQPPIYKLAGTNLSGHKRFTSSIARRLDQLGALTKGQKDASGSSMFNATDNLENEFADTAVQALFNEIWRGEFEGLTPADVKTELGIDLVGEGGLNTSKIPAVTQFLNRLLNTKIDRQNMIFDRFIEHMETAVQQAVADGQFTAGVEAVEHDGAVLIDTKEAFRDKITDATSQYQMVKLTKKVKVTPFVDFDEAYANIRYKRDRDTGAVYGFRPASSRTNDRGQVIPTYHRHSPTDRTLVDSSDYQFKYEMVQHAEAEKAWAQAIEDAPATREENLHMVTGALLQIWDRLPSSSPKIVRLQLDDGRSLLGREIPDVELTKTLENLGVTGPEIDMSAAEIQAAVMGGKTIVLSSGHKMVRRRVGGELRIEVIPPANSAYQDTMPGGNLQRMGFQIERIQYKARAFVGNTEKGQPAIDAFMTGKNIINVTMERDQAAAGSPSLTLGNRPDNPGAKTNAEKPYAIWSKRDNKIVGYAATKNGGRGAVDRRDNQYGGYNHRLIDNPSYQGMEREQRVDQGPLAPYREQLAESRVFKMLNAELTKLGLGDVELQFDPFFEHQGKVYADHFGRIVITIGNTLNPRWTMNHEAIHIYKHMGLFSKSEWEVLAAEAEKEWLDRYGIADRYPDLTREEQIEEAIAEAFGEASEKNTGFKTTGPVRTALRQINQFLKAIRNWAKGLGLKSPDDVFEAMARGEFAKRKDVKGWESQTARLMKQQRRPNSVDRKQGGLYLPDRYIWDTLVNSTGSMFARAKEVRGAVDDRMDLVRTRIQDRFLPVLRAQQVIERQMNAPIPEELNAYLAEEMYSGRAGYKLDVIDEQYTTKIIQIIGDTKGVTTETVGRFLYARHAAERNKRISEINEEMPDGGSGMDTKEADVILKEIKDSPQAAAYDEIAELIDKLREWTIQERVDMGLMRKEEADAWRKAYDFYVPLKGWAETDFSDAELDITGIGRGYNVRGAETKRAMGRKSEAFNPLIAAITQAQEVAVRSEKNRVGQHLYRLAKDVPAKGLFEVKKVEETRVFNESTGLVERRNMSPITLMQAENELAVKVDGEEYRVVFNDPRLARSATRVGVDNLGAILKPLSMFGRYISTVNTMLNPEFVITNFARDTVTANINIQSKELGSKIQRGMMKDLPKAMRGAYRGLGGKSDTEWSQYFQEFSEAGAKVSFWVMENPEANEKIIAKRLKREANGAKGMALALVTPNTDLNPVLKAMERINLAVDNAIRLAAFVNARKNGMTTQQAASLSKNLTVNFNRRGDYGSAINAAYVFANAAMQGTHIMFKALKSRRVQAIVTGMVLISFLLDQANAYLSEEDEDGQLAYDKLPDFKQERSLVIMLGRDSGDAITLPMPYGYNVFTYMGNRLSKMARGAITKEEAMSQTALAAFNSFSPISGGNFMNMITPTILDPALEIATNEDWLGRPIYPDYPNMTGPDSQRYFGSATDAARVAAEKVNAWTGGTYAESGYVDVSPETVDHISGFLTGGTGRFFGRSTDLFAKIFQGKDVEVNDVPFARTLYTDTGEWLDRSTYFDRRTEVREAYAAAKAYIEKGDPVPDQIRWKAELYKVQLQAERYRRGTTKVDKDEKRAYLLLNTAFNRSWKANTPYSSESIFD